MEPDRYQQNSKLFVIGLICLLLCLSLLAIALFILPYLLWDWRYGVPGMVLELHEWFKENYDFSDGGASWMVFLTFIIPALICGFISQWASNYIERKMYGLDEARPGRRMEIHKDLQESVSFGLKIFILIILVVLGVALVEWLILLPSI
ncbi:MAG: hypothetical protein H0T84_14660 [Tatlockia sp.]|nr:hypothetical protein [Tatlockia sp.]